MKKFFPLALFCFLFSLSASLKAAEPTLHILEGGIPYTGFMPLDISSNGKYICGSTFLGPIFVADWQKGEIRTPGTSIEEQKAISGELRSITDSGFCVGLGPTYDWATDALGYTRTADITQRIRGGLTDAISNDGSIITGLAYIQDDPLYYAAYWENGNAHLLPVPTEEETGWRIYGSRARFISDDGNIIAGYMTDRLSTFPLIYWTRTDDGSYEMHPVFLDYFCDSKVHDKPYFRFSPQAMSPDGQWIALSTMESTTTGYFTEPNILALYHIPTGEMKKIAIDGNHGIPRDIIRLQVWDHGIANDGTIVGWFEDRGGRFPFIVFPEELVARAFTDAFPTIDNFFAYDEIGDDAVSCISANGRYVGGCAWILSEEYDMGYYEAYVLDTGRNISPDDDEAEKSGVSDILPDPDAAPEYYDIAGHRLNAPVRGINIVRMSDGTTRKVIIK